MKNVLIVLLLAISTVVSAATYYIDPAGSDSNSGSGSSPWKTLAYACSKATGSGDIIHVNAGTYTETNRCVLAVGVSIEGVGITSIIKSHYVGGSDMNTGLIMLSGGTNSGQHISGIKLDGDGLTGDNAIVIYNRSNVSINNCSIVNFSAQGVRFSGSSNNTGNTFYNNTVSNCGGRDTDEHANLSLSYNTGLSVYGNTITQRDRTYTSRGLCIQVEDAIYGLKIYNNYIYGNDAQTISGTEYFPFAIEFWNSSHTIGGGIEMYGNTIEGEVDFGSSPTKGSYAFGVDFHHNTLGFNSPSSETRTALEFEDPWGDVIIRNNVIRNVDRPMYFCGQGSGKSYSNLSIYSNILYNVVYNARAQQTPQGYSAHGAGIMFGSMGFGSLSGVYIRNNTIIAYSTSPAEVGIYLPTSSDIDNVYVQNNIIVGFAKAPIIAENQGGGSLTTLVLQKNLYYGNGNSNALLLTSITPTGLSNDNGILADPLFVSSTDFHLQGGSPAIGKGLSITEITTDFAGSPRKDPSSIGAYENNSVVMPPVVSVPVYTASVIQNVTPSLVEMTYNLSLANIIPAATAFKVQVNSVARTVNSVVISGSKVLLTLASAIKSGEIVTVSYAKPASNPLQIATGGQAISISGQLIVNNIVTQVTNPSTASIKMTISPNPVHQIINILFEYTAFSITDAARSPQIIRIFNTTGKLYLEKLLDIGIAKVRFPINLTPGIYTVIVLSGGLQMSSQKLKVY